MPTSASDPSPRSLPAAPGVVLRLVVRDHPGVMSHVCGLFARRAFNVEGIACLPLGDDTRSIVLLLVREDARLEQVMRQLAKLVDVLEIRREADDAAFADLARALGCPPPAGMDPGRAP